MITLLLQPSEISLRFIMEIARTVMKALNVTLETSMMKLQQCSPSIKPVALLEATA